MNDQTPTSVHSPSPSLPRPLWDFMYNTATTRDHSRRSAGSTKTHQSIRRKNPEKNTNHLVQVQVSKVTDVCFITTSQSFIHSPS